MSLIQFLRILWSYRLLTALTTSTAAIGALIAVLIVPPSYDGKTRMMLNTLKPDPVTGEVIQNAAVRTYIATQLELIRDLGVAGQAVDNLGWANNPDTIQAYRANDQDADIRRALAQRIIDRTQTSVVPGTNIVEISFRAATPDDARVMANALREAYVDSTLSSRRREAARNADWFAQQAESERVQLEKADEAKTQYERANGIVMQDDKVDVETARLRALAGQGMAPGAAMAAPVAQQSSAAAIQLAQLDAQIAQGSKTLGPNHPTMVNLRAQRATLAKVVANDEAAAKAMSNSAASAMSASAGALDAAVRQQTSRVIANRSKIQALTDLQAEVNLHRAQMERSLTREADFRQEAAIADSGITVLSEAITPTSPSFPKKPLIFGGAIAIGGAAGLLLSLIFELLRRRVRGAEDLEAAIDAPLLAVIAAGAPRPRSRKPAAIGDRVKRSRRRIKPA